MISQPYRSKTRAVFPLWAYENPDFADRERQMDIAVEREKRRQRLAAVVERAAAAGDASAAGALLLVMSLEDIRDRLDDLSNQARDLVLR